MERGKRLNWLANLANVIEEACQKGINAKEIEAAVNVGINAYKKGLTDEIHSSEE